MQHLFIVLQANDSYLQMAIGNAPWPIGVTMVGIHARTGREKIFAQNVARIPFESHCFDFWLFKTSVQETILIYKENFQGATSFHRREEHFELNFLKYKRIFSLDGQTGQA